MIYALREKFGISAASRSELLTSGLQKHHIYEAKSKDMPNPLLPNYPLITNVLLTST